MNAGATSAMLGQTEEAEQRDNVEGSVSFKVLHEVLPETGRQVMDGVKEYRKEDSQGVERDAAKTACSTLPIILYTSTALFE